MRKWVVLLYILVGLFVVPSAVYAQASIAGVVRDTSGAVLPGVSVEAASDALIEKVRSVVSDGSGQYRIIDLRPGTYAVTFNLPGFRPFRREGIELTGEFAATVNAEMSVGSLEETITVTGASPLVDAQNARQQTVISQETMNAVPSTRTAFGLATLIPSISSNNAGDTGGTNSISLVFLTSHGSRTTDQRITIDGLSANSAEGAGQYSAYMPNISSSQEMAVDYAGGTAEMETGGVRVNVIPKDGGNTFRGGVFVGGTTGALQGDNFTEEIKARGLPAPIGIKKLWDYNPGFGGPIMKDRLWFYTAFRYNGEENYTGGFANANAGNPARWDFVADPNNRTRIWHEQHSANVRLTWQVSPKHKLSAFYDDQWRCSCPNTLSPTTAPESSTEWHYPWAHVASLTWSSPLTNRLLFEAGLLRHPEQWFNALPGADTQHPEGQTGPLGEFIAVNEQSNSLSYRGMTSLVINDMVTWRSRASMSYVTGSHSFKVGVAQQFANRDWLNRAPAGGENLAYRFNNGIPNQLTQYLRPELIRAQIPLELGLFAQDQWTAGKLTANLGVRYNHLETTYPESRLGPTRFAPDRNIYLPTQDQVNWHDIVPRLGAAYDLFGNGKTAIKASLNKYMLAVGLQGFFGDGSNPVMLFGNTTSRSWNDNFYPAGDPRRGNFVPDCDLLSPLANTECGAMANQNFGKPVQSAAVDPAILRGWGSRAYNWETGLSVQHQLTPRVSMNVGYFRRWYGNFVAKDNLATTAADYDKYSIPAPVDPRLPDGGGYIIGDLYNLKPEKVGQADYYYTFADAYGKQVENWSGVDLSMNTRLPNGVILQGGMSTGRTVQDNCEVLAKSPEITSSTSPAGAGGGLSASPANTYCHENSGYRATVKGFGAYMIPKAQVQVGVTLQSFIPISQISANYNAPNAVITPSLGRPLSGGAANASVNLIEPGVLSGDRVYQFDMSFGKILRFGRTRTNLKVDVYNLFNSNAILSENSSYGAFRQALSISQARFAKLGVQFDF